MFTPMVFLIVSKKKFGEMQLNIMKAKWDELISTHIRHTENISKHLTTFKRNLKT